TERDDHDGGRTSTREAKATRPRLNERPRQPRTRRLHPRRRPASNTSPGHPGPLRRQPGGCQSPRPATLTPRQGGGPHYELSVLEFKGVVGVSDQIRVGVRVFHSYDINGRPRARPEPRMGRGDTTSGEREIKKLLEDVA